MLNKDFKIYLEEAIGRDNAAIAFSAFDAAPSVSLRLNPFKLMRDSGAHFSSFDPASAYASVETVAWNPYGRILEKRPNFTLDPALHAGAYYVQDSSSMFVGEIFRQSVLHRFGNDFPTREGRVLRVLDLCAAPGGKTTDLAASLRLLYGNDFILVANEVMKSRATVLADNVALWGDPNVLVTSADPAAFGSMKHFFDLIVADVPCSGEGMFRKDENAIAQWSKENVALCASRQRRIIADVWDALAPEGVLVYSTCTFNRYENDDNVQWICGELGGTVLKADRTYDTVLETSCGYSLVPGMVTGEGQYCAAVLKDETVEPSGPDSRHRQETRRRQGAKGNGLKLPGNSSYFDREVNIRQKGDLLIAIPKTISADLAYVEAKLKPIAAGCAIGELKGRDLVPAADLALCNMLSDEAFVSVDVDRTVALAFLHRDNLRFDDMPKGYLKLRYCGLGLGFVKNIGNRCNNLHPQNRRIRMDINE